MSEERKPTHYCVICAARWLKHPDDTWSLVTAECGPCCDNVPMDKAPIVPLQANGTVKSADHSAAKRAWDAEQRRAHVAAYGGIVCVICDESFERHSSSWECPRRVVPRFKFPKRENA